MQTVTVRIPKVWRELLELDLEGMPRAPAAKAGGPTKADDPEGYVEDYRISFAEYNEDVNVDVCLRSGRHNYWLEVEWFKDGVTFELSEPLHAIGDEYTDASGQWTVIIEEY